MPSTLPTVARLSTGKRLPMKAARFGLVLAVSITAFTRIAHASDPIETFLEPYKTIEVAAAESGIVDKVDVIEGQNVSAGQPVAHLDQDIHKAALEIARKGMEGRGQINAAQSELTQATNRHKKLLTLRQKDHATPEEVSRAEMEQAVAEARLLIAQETLEIRAAEFERYRIQLDRRTVRTPISGVVIRVHRDEGEFINPADPTIVTVVQLDPLIATFSVPESKVAGLNTTSEVKIRVVASGRVTPVEVELVSPVINAQTATVNVKVKVPNKEGKYRAGERCHLLFGDSLLSSPAAPTLSGKTSPAVKPSVVAPGTRPVSDQRTKDSPASSTKSESR